tara:strand:- start:28 stop:2292 length:2265 start_codon:yes stop_codon:yes gene_type:complete
MSKPYKFVKGEPFIKYNGTSYLVTRSVMRDGKVTQQYQGKIKSLTEAKKVRARFIKEIPVQTVAESNIKRRGTTKIDIKELNKSARFFYKRGEVSSPYYSELPVGAERKKIYDNVRKGATPGKFSKETIYTPLKKSQQNKILKFFPDADFDTYKFGFNPKQDTQNYNAVSEFVKRGYKPAYYNVPDLPKKTQNLIIEAFGKQADEAGTPLVFGKGRKFGVTAKENEFLRTRIANFIQNTGKTYPFAFSFADYPENWIIQQMQRASKNNPRYDIIKNKDGKIIGAIEDGVEYYHAASKIGNTITNHPEAEKISKIVDIAKKAKSSIPVSLSKMLPKGFDTNLVQGNQGYSDLLRWLDNSEGRRTVQNAIQLHHAGKGAVTGSPALAKDIQLLTFNDNLRAESIRTQILKNDLSGVQELKDKGIRLNVGGKEYGAGFETPEAGLKRIEKQAGIQLAERLKLDPKLSSFEGFLKQKPIGAVGTLLESVASLKPGTKAFKTVCTITKAEGGSVDACVERVAQEPEKFANKFKNITAESGPLVKIKNAATNFLKSPGFKTFGAGAAIGTAIGLVKEFRNDDPTTYLSNEDQQKSMLVDMFTQPISEDLTKPDILDFQLPAVGASLAASTALGAPSTIKASRSRGLGVEQKGLIRTGGRVLGRGLGIAASPGVLAPLAALDITRQVSEGDSLEDITTDPLNYLYPAFADQTPKITRGLPSTFRKVARLGLSKPALRLLSRAGIGGFAASAAIQGLGLLDD